jgi:hypothetical protein
MLDFPIKMGYNMVDTVGKYMGSNNVILFPKKNIGAHTGAPMTIEASMEEVDRNVDMIKYYHIQETIANIAPMIFNHLDIAGFDISDEDTTTLKDGAFIVESMRSLMCKYYDLHHPFQTIVDNVFVADNDEENALRIVDTLNISLKKNDDN